MTAWRDVDDAEKRGLIDAVDDQAEAFLTACVHFARLMQLEAEPGLASSLLKVQTENMLRLYQYYEQNIDPITGKVPPEEPKQPPIGRRGGVL